MASNMKANETTASRIDRVATLARERRGEEDQMNDVANNQANMFHRNLANLGIMSIYGCISRHSPTSTFTSTTTPTQLKRWV